MMKERLLWDRFLYRIRESGLMPEGGNILDVGTGTNTTMLEMYGDRWDVTPSDVNVGDWNAHIPGMIYMDANCLDVTETGEWDAIILSEVLEHVEDPLHVLTVAHKALRPGGVLIISVPFMYRIHEYGSHDPETSEPGLLDYWRFTPNGLRLLLSKIRGFETVWVGRLITGDKKSFPEWERPAGVAGWAVKDTGAFGDAPCVQNTIGEEEWQPEIPDNWRQLQTEMAEAYAKEVENARKAVESV